MIGMARTSYSEKSLNVKSRRFAPGQAQCHQENQNAQEYSYQHGHTQTKSRDEHKTSQKVPNTAPKVLMVYKMPMLAPAAMASAVQCFARSGNVPPINRVEARESEMPAQI